MPFTRCSRWSLCLLLPALTAAAALADVQPHAGMLQYPDVSATHIVFAYANDLWVVPREGGVASPLANPAGVETFPRFSADGQTIAFQGNYDGDVDLYVIPLAGGPAQRVTHHPTSETLTDWTADGRLIFQASGMGDFTFLQLFIVPPAGGLPEKLPVPYGGNGTISKDGTWLAYTPYVRDQRTWKRYRGGRASDVWLFNLKTNESRRITDWEGTDSIPMWHPKDGKNGQPAKLYYLSDAGPNHRLNIWEYDPQTQQHRQITQLDEYDVKWPAMGPGPNGDGEIIFQHGSALYLLDLKTAQAKPVEVIIPGDRPKIRRQNIDASDYIQANDISSTGKRAVFEARGDIWTVPAEDGVTLNLTRTSGVAERDPIWSPDGRWIAYFSDADGEYDLYVLQSDGKAPARKLAPLGEGYRYMRTWSPDSRYIAFVDKFGKLYIAALENGAITHIDTEPGGGEPGMSWSHDARWITYTKECENFQDAIWLYNVETGEKHQVTSGVFNDRSPTFDRKGDYLYFASSRSFQSPLYEDVGSSFIYTNTHVMCAVPLRADLKYPWLPKNEQESWEKDKKDGEKKDKDKEDKKEDEEKKDDEPADKKDNEKPDDEKKDDKKKEEKQDAAEDGISGTYEGVIKGSEPLPPEGLPFTLVLSVTKDGSVSGNMSGGPYQGTIVTGRYDKSDNTLNFSLQMQTEEGLSTFAVTATVTGSKITGTVTGDEFSATFECERTAGPGAADDEDEDDDEPRKRVKIDLEGFEQRAFELPVGRGRFWGMAVNDKNQLIYTRSGAPGSGQPTEIKLFDITDKDKAEKTVVSGAGSFSISGDGKKLLVRSGGYAIIDARAGQKLSDKISLRAMRTVADPREEWRQMFHEVWRIQRDFFYVENMHGTDWEAVRDSYAKMLPDCVSRDDLAYVIREMISELNVGHAYYRGGASESGPTIDVGLLGVDFTLENDAYRIKKIHAGGVWDVDARNPLRQQGVDIKEGAYVLAVNGIPLDTSKDPWAAFVGLGGQTVILTVSEKPERDDEAREVLVDTLRNENELRYRSWVEANRKYVEEQTGGRVGYIHVPDTGVNGQNELLRQFYGQRHKGALIIDERWNRGGQIPHRFIELLNRPLLNYWARREGRDSRTPPDAHFGPKCMLINESAGSGGDMFPKLFKQVGLGKLIGRRTWGGLVGISGNPRLIDGTGVTVPTFGYYEVDGTWGVEGHGVDPDIEVIDDPALMVDGGDPQLDAAIKHIIAELEQNPYVPAERPEPPDRSGMGLPESDR